MAYNSSGFRVSVMPQTNFLDPRLLAPNANLLQNFQQGVGAAGQLGSLADMITARNRVAATQADAIAAENARNKLVAAGSLADLGQLPQRTAVAGQRLNLEGGQLTGQLGNLQTQQELDAATLQAQAAEAARKKSVLEQTAAPRTATDLLNVGTDLGKAENQFGNLNLSNEADIAAARARITAAQEVVDHAAEKKAFEAQNPGAPAAEFEAQYAARKAEKARAATQLATGGATPAEVTAQENQARLNELNAGQLEVAKQNAVTNAAKVAAAANDPLKLSKVHLELGKSMLSNGVPVEDAIAYDAKSGWNPKTWFYTNPSQSDRVIMQQYMDLTKRMTGGIGALGSPVPVPAPAFAVAPVAASGPYAAFEGKILNGPNGAKVRIVNGNPVPVK